MLRVFVHPEGKTLGAVVAVSSGDDSLDQAAVKAANLWRFHPRPQAHGIGLASVPVRFQLQ